MAHSSGESTTVKARLTILTVIVLQLSAGMALAGDGDRFAVCGRLGECGGLAVLAVWGTPEEAGFAHGYLCAEAIVRLFDEAVLDPSVGVAPAVHEGLLLAASRRMFTWQPGHERELEGLLRGVRATRVLTDLVSLVRHAVQLDDELVPYPEQVQQRYQNWLAAQEAAGRTFTPEQRWWLDEIAEHIGVSLEIAPEDLDGGEFFNKGGRIGALRTFGPEWMALLAELNATLTV